MIINIEQTHSALKQTFDVYFDNEFKYHGKLGSFSYHQDIVLSEDNGNKIKACFRPGGIKNLIPFIEMFGGTVQRNFYSCYKENVKIGSIYEKRQGIGKRKYIIVDEQFNIELQAYYIAHGRYGHICIYAVDFQIAQVEIDLYIQNGCNNYTLFLIDENEHLAELLSLFVLYFDNLNFTQRGQIQIGRTNSREYTLSKYNDKFSSDWIDDNFHLEN